jgi:hypothetical protein
MFAPAPAVTPNPLIGLLQGFAHGKGWQRTHPGSAWPTAGLENVQHPLEALAQGPHGHGYRRLHGLPGHGNLPSAVHPLVAALGAIHNQ